MYYGNLNPSNQTSDQTNNFCQFFNLNLSYPDSFYSFIKIRCKFQLTIEPNTKPLFSCFGEWDFFITKFDFCFSTFFVGPLLMRFRKNYGLRFWIIIGYYVLLTPLYYFLGIFSRTMTTFLFELFEAIKPKSSIIKKT